MALARDREGYRAEPAGAMFARLSLPELFTCPVSWCVIPPEVRQNPGAKQGGQAMSTPPMSLLVTEGGTCV